MNYATQAFDWLLAHPFVLGLLLWLALNLARRMPEPANKSGLAHAVWETFERFMVTAYDQWGGPFKALGSPPKSGADK
jgi:hypothetical protein